MAVEVHMFLAKSKLFYCLVAFLPLAPLQAADPIPAIDKFIEQARVEWHVPGVAVSIVQGDKVLLSKGYGLAKYGADQKVDENTIFQLASISKAFTAAAIGVQVDAKKIAWDEEIIRILPAFALKDIYSSRYTSARDLLAHRTGLPAFGGDLMGKIGYRDKEILYRARFVDPATSFREKAQYSNLGYFIAGEVIAAITGQSWEDTVQSTLLTPLKMSRTGFGSNLKNSNVSANHVLFNNEIKIIPADTTGGFHAAGAITSTAADMTKWMIMLLNGGHGILKADTIQEMFKPSMVGEIGFSEAPPIDENSGFNYGMGWDNFHYQGQLIIEKGGGLDGVRTVTTLIPGLKLGITVLCNLNLTLLPEAIRGYLLEQYLGNSGKDLQASIKERSESLDSLLVPDEKPKDILPARDLNLYTGTFENQLYFPFTIVKEGEKLALEVGPNKYKGKLAHFSNDTFTLSWETVNMGNQQVTFTMGPEGKATGIQTETLGRFERKN